MRLIVFDMDGTLIDTEALISEHMGSAFASLDLPAPTPAEVRQIIGLSLPVAVGQLARTDDIDLIEGIVGQYKQFYRASLADDIDREPLYPGARDALDRLRAQRGTILGVATGKGLTGVARILGKHGIAGHFVTLQTPDHNPSKPHPGMLLSAMAETGAPPEQTVMIGDSVYDMELARAANVRAIGVTWGYHDAADLLKAGAGALIHNYSELEAAIERVLE
ncbi:HAD-IA family hydrolase [Devosia sp. ZB163]|uniref:HAD-IA family hydrolase n=1 Tax=Devosia sp. ZB163 TaxID=3025938 RepID=UPI00235F15F4|nr:HAD-IA family hydrolase [Devosia sp. ZB163]MDC9824678.1 HAD-IA family hydrolase [Devosia sp. ZB163]